MRLRKASSFRDVELGSSKKIEAHVCLSQGRSNGKIFRDCTGDFRYPWSYVPAGDIKLFPEAAAGRVMSVMECIK